MTEERQGTRSRTIETRASEWRANHHLRVYRGLAVTACTLALAVTAATAFTAWHVANYVIDAGWSQPVVVTVAVAIVLGAVLFAVTGARSLVLSARAAGTSDVYRGRALGAAAAESGWRSLAYSLALSGLCVGAGFLVVNDAAVSRTFFDAGLIVSSAGTILAAFVVNLEIFAVSAALILVWALVIAVARTLPGRAGRPLRALAIAYCDFFRGLPVIINIYLIGFGLPLTGLPFLKDLSSNTYAIIALTLTYGAYTSEIYRAGIESVHPSQIAAARSLGLSYFRTLRHVVIPLAVRGVIPPLLNNMISLQKDTALVAIIGTIDAFNQSKIIASNHFNLSAVTTVALIFILITIPQARFVDRLIERDRRRMRAGQ
ncbi:amino acid ABC transporter permease [Allorhizobium borbori]|uniref:Polar amino acid transport system permease protein n=1 Tax=Allorhizobium borbori TaxID=485907 RepID=A0A7W6K5A6_9HYPH|nr:amino acid ABC transporter permease [Allorhizobium borbori]MBB4105448.1 polar amino acid transport system permease protein [Allorhizobium borbori]